MGMPTEVPKKSWDTLDDVRDYIRTRITDSRDYIIELAKARDSELNEVCEADEKDLPKHINVKSAPAQEMLRSRLKDDKLNLEPFLQVLYDTDFDYEDYQNLGENDGLLGAMSHMARMLGMDEESSRAYEAIYSMD
jgi:hypothetical protein